MIKTGIVMSIKNSKAGIMTSNGEFVYIKINKIIPKIGEIYTGKLCRNNSMLTKYIATAASIMFMFLSSVGAYAYYSPVTNVTVSINPSINLSANRWNKIISLKPLNSDGKTILTNISLKNKSIDRGLELIVKEAKNKNFINERYIEENKTITVDINSKKNISIDISDFKNIIDKNNLKVSVSTSCKNNTNIDIIANNKKMKMPNLIYNKNKNNDNLQIKNSNEKKSSINPSSDINKDKNSNIKLDSKNINVDNAKNNLIKNENKDKNPKLNNNSSITKTENLNKNEKAKDKVKSAPETKYNNSIEHPSQTNKKKDTTDNSGKDKKIEDDLDDSHEISHKKKKTK